MTVAQELHFGFALVGFVTASSQLSVYPDSIFGGYYASAFWRVKALHDEERILAVSHFLNCPAERARAITQISITKDRGVRDQRRKDQREWMADGRSVRLRSDFHPAH